MSNSKAHNLGRFFSTISNLQRDKAAIRHVDETTFSFNELEILSNRIAYFLLDRGIVKEDVVAILNNKSNISYAIMLACLKVGAIYTNIDPKSPIERFYKMVDLCSPKLLFSSNNRLIQEATVYSEITIDYNSEPFLERIASFSTSLPEENIQVDCKSPAYIMFTSGWLVKASPVIAPSPLTKLKTPWGNLASSIISASIIEDRGASSDGFNTIVQPAANAGITLRHTWFIGQFHGVINAQTPFGSYNIL